MRLAAPQLCLAAGTGANVSMISTAWLHVGNSSRFGA
jgi:hypothetical protein